MREINYDELAELLGVSPRQARITVAKNTDVITPKKYGHRTIRFTMDSVSRLLNKLDREAIRRGRIIPKTYRKEAAA